MKNLKILLKTLKGFILSWKTFFTNKTNIRKEIIKKVNIIVNKAVYTATEVACGWAGAVMQKPPVNAEKSKR